MSSAATLDPTLETLQALEDRSRWVIVPNVPIFDEHDEHDKDGKLVRRFDERKLNYLADIINRRESDLATPVRLTIGHTLGRNPVTGQEPKETDQPPHVGFARKARVGRFGPKQKLGLLADLYYRREDWDDAKTFPYRSIELYPGSWDITGVALLRRDPRLDLGVLTYQRDEARIIYQSETSMDPATNAGADQDDERFYQRLHKHPAFKYACEKYQAETGDKELGGFAKYMAPAASGSNGSIPAPVAGGADDDPMRMQRDQQAIHYARLEAELVEVKRVAADMQLRYQRAERERDLVQLEAEGYQFDRAELLTEVAALPQDHYARRLEGIRKYFRRAPIGGDFVRTANLPPPRTGGQEFPADKINAAVRHMEQKNCTIEEALEAVMKS